MWRGRQTTWLTMSVSMWRGRQTTWLTMSAKVGKVHGLPLDSQPRKRPIFKVERWLLAFDSLRGFLGLLRFALPGFLLLLRFGSPTPCFPYMSYAALFPWAKRDLLREKNRWSLPLSKIKLARRLKGIKAPQPSLVADDGGSSPFVVDSKDVEHDRAPDVEPIMVDNWVPRSGSGTKESF
ncbi:hypothetical protein ACSQ67_023719 [Phaseolus vulgaris]